MRRQHLSLRTEHAYVGWIRRFVLANPRYEQIYGWPAGTLLGRSGRVVWDSDDEYLGLGATLGPVLARGEAVEIETWARRFDGSSFLARITGKAIDPAHPGSGGTIWIVDDITGPVGEEQLGRLAAFVRDRRVTLEMCPSSNVHVGAVPSIDKHPIGMLAALRYRVTVNTDNRLITDTTVSKELFIVHSEMGVSWPAMKSIILNGFKSAFLPFHERQTMLRQAATALSVLERELSLEPTDLHPALATSVAPSALS